MVDGHQRQRPKVDLVPWDPNDQRQFQRMVAQRIACGWRAEEVPEWKLKVLKGVKLLYWVVSAQYWLTSCICVF